jgi:glyoxylate/hydroxypyruvate reductase A
MTQILFAAAPHAWEAYKSVLPDALANAGIQADLILHAAPHDPARIDWVVYSAHSDLQDFTPYTRLKGVLSLWAGVEQIEANRTLTAPLARMVDPAGLTQGMVEWVTGHVLRHHLEMDAHIVNPDRIWAPTAPPLAADRPITILGMGELGAACARALVSLGFPVTGWARTPRDIPGVKTLTGAPEGALAAGQIAVLLLPHTRLTEDIINATRLAAMPAGSVLINPGRGALVVESDLLGALDRGHLSHATLDTFRSEPLPQDHPFWAHPKITVTPHIASETRPASAAQVLVENIRRGEAGEPLLHLVDRTDALA